MFTVTSMGLGRVTGEIQARFHFMRGTPARILSVTCMLVAATAAPAAPLYKCVVNRTVTYQQAPCPSNQARKELSIAELNAAEKQRRAAATPSPAATPRMPAPVPATVSSGFRCDGRTYCSQMRSCEEAQYFLAHCPNVKMDGNGDGIPCEQQWCGR